MVLLKESCSLRTIGRRSFSARREEARCSPPSPNPDPDPDPNPNPNPNRGGAGREAPGDAVGRGARLRFP